MINAQKGQIRSLEKKIKILEDQKKKLTDARNGLAKHSEKLEKIVDIS